jgi:hypothetical protein
MTLRRFAIRAWIAGPNPRDGASRLLLPERYLTAFRAQEAADRMNGHRMADGWRVVSVQVIELLEGGRLRSLPRQKTRN